MTFWGTILILALSFDRKFRPSNVTLQKILAVCGSLLAMSLVGYLYYCNMLAVQSINELNEDLTKEENEAPMQSTFIYAAFLFVSYCTIFVWVFMNFWLAFIVTGISF